MTDTTAPDRPDRNPTLDLILTNRWTAIPNDEIGGWCVTADGRSPANGGLIAVDMIVFREVAEQIAADHNQRLAVTQVKVRAGAAIVRGQRYELTPLTIQPERVEEFMRRWRQLIDAFDPDGSMLGVPEHEHPQETP